MYGLIELKAPGCVGTVSSPQIINTADATSKMIINKNIVVRLRFISSALEKEPNVKPIIVRPLVAIADRVDESLGVVSTIYAATQLDASPQDNP